MPSSNWSFYVEGIGQSHNNKADLDDANRHALDFLKALEKNGCHRIFQARFQSDRGEENWMDSATREMHEDLCSEINCLASANSPPGPALDPHSELVELGVKADATQKQSAGPSNVRSERRKINPRDTKISG